MDLLLIYHKLKMLSIALFWRRGEHLDLTYGPINHSKNKDISLIIVLIVALVFTTSFGLVNILKFRIFSPTCFGWSYPYTYSKLAKGNSIFNIYVLPEYAVLYFSLSPINYLLIFIYKFLPKPEILFILQSVIMASGVLPIYLLVKNRLHNVYLATTFPISYLFHPIVTTGAMLGYIPIALGLPFLLFAFYYLEKRNLKKFIFFIILANMSKIDMVVMTLILGIILSFSKEKNKYGRAILKINSIWLIVAITFCSIYLKLINKPFPAPLLHFDKYGDKLIDALKYTLNNPSLILKNLFNLNNMLIYIFNRLPNIFSFLSPIYLLPIIPEVGFILIRNQHSSGHFLILPFVFLGAIYGIEKIINIISKLFIKYRGTRLKKALLLKIFAIAILIPVLIQHYYAKPQCDFTNNLGPIPFTKDFNFRFYILTRHTEIGHKFLNMIPSQASCLTLQSLALHLGRCKYLGLFRRQDLMKDYNWDYVFVDLFKNDFYQIDSREYFLKLRQFLTKDNYGVLAFQDGWLLLKKGYAKDRNSEVLSYINEFLLNEKGI